MAITTFERPVPRERSRPAPSSAALTLPVWVEPVRPVSQPTAAKAPMGVVIALRPACEPAAGRRARLTRRGRLTLTLATACCVFAIGAVAASSSTTSARPAPTSAASVVVAPGDTLWEVAVRVDPYADPRVTVARIIELNDLSGGHVRPGQTLQLPAG